MENETTSFGSLLRSRCVWPSDTLRPGNTLRPVQREPSHRPLKRPRIEIGLARCNEVKRCAPVKNDSGYPLTTNTFGQTILIGDCDELLS